MGYRNKDKLTIFFLALLIASGIFGLTKIIQDNVKKPNNLHNVSESVEQSVKGDAEMVNCEVISPLVDKLIESTSLSRKWYLKESGLDNQYTQIFLEISNQNITETDLKFFDLKYVIDGTDIKGKIDYSNDSKKWIAKVDLSTLEVGEYTLAISSDIKHCEYTNEKKLLFYLSYPVYVTWTLDWEGSDVKQSDLDLISLLSSKYNMPITHFFNPYIYYRLSPQRASELTKWVITRSKSGKDSIGLHLHMYNKLLEVYGVTPRSGGWGYANYGVGYDVPSAEYTYEEYKKILEGSKQDFIKNGLSTPTMFRAGGWFADEENLRALADSGFNIDSSGRSPYTLGSNKLQGPWSLSSTTQPYKLNSLDQNNISASNMDLWEIPNNGGSSWDYDENKLIDFFKDNYKGGISKEIKAVTYLSHPQAFALKDNKRMDILLNNISRYSLMSDSGPVVFSTIDKLPQVGEN